MGMNLKLEHFFRIESDGKIVADSPVGFEFNAPMQFLAGLTATTVSASDRGDFTGTLAVTGTNAVMRMEGAGITDAGWEIKTNGTVRWYAKAPSGSADYVLYNTAGTEVYRVNQSSGNFVYAGGITLGGKLNLGSPTDLTIASDTITVTKSFHNVDVESGTADNLSTINGGSAGDILILSSKTSANDVTLTEVGNLVLAGTFTLSHPGDTITLVNDGTNWRETSRSDNAA